MLQNIERANLTAALNSLCLRFSAEQLVCASAELIKAAVINIFLY